MKIKAKLMGNPVARLCMLVVFTMGILLTVDTAYAMTAGAMADQITGSFAQIAKLISAAAYIAGLGFAIGAILKFKQHKDNPTQIPVGTPIALLFVAAALVFLPTIFDIAGATLFGEGTATTGGAKGIEIAPGS